MPTLADMRSNKPSTDSRPERLVRLCLRPDIIARVEKLTGELGDLPEPTPRPRKMVETPEEAVDEHPRAAEIRDEIAGLLREQREAEGDMAVKATRTDGEWRRWADAHPAREEGQPGHKRDKRLTDGLVNADALMDDLGTYAWSWNGERLADGDWAELFDPVVDHGQKYEMVETVVTMYEGRVDFRRWRTALSAALRMSNDSDSQETSESATSGSTDGNPSPSSED